MDQIGNTLINQYSILLHVSPYNFALTFYTQSMLQVIRSEWCGCKAWFFSLHAKHGSGSKAEIKVSRVGRLDFEIDSLQDLMLFKGLNGGQFRF